MSRIQIRRGTPGDVPALRVLYQQLDDVHGIAEPEVVPMHDQAPRAVADIEEQIANDIVLVAVRADDAIPEGQVVGFARITVKDLGAYYMFPDVAEVEDLAVLEGLRGQGVGRRLMAAAEEWAATAGHVELWVTAWTFNETAAALYSRQGFKPLSTRFRKRLHPRAAPGGQPAPAEG